MANQVYANMMEVSCKAADGKSICAFPDPCLTPPPPPGVPIPYPNTGLASDCTEGSSTVQISGQEVMLKNKSYFKKSSGDEAGSAPLKGVVTHTISGKVYFNSWSMDVSMEGENVVRHLDLTTHNHNPPPGNTPTWPYIDAMAFSSTGPCKDLGEALETKCPPAPTARDRAKWVKAMCESTDSSCRDAMECVLTTYAPRTVHKDGTKTQGNCCPGKTPHHLVEVHCFAPINDRTGVMQEFRNAAGKGYSLNKAPCLCVEGPREDKEHGECHAVQQQLEAAYNQSPSAPRTAMSVGGQSNWTYGQARDAGLEAQSITKPGCDRACTKAQLDAYHNKAPPNGPGCNDSTPVRSDLGAHGRPTGSLTTEAQAHVTGLVEKINPPSPEIATPMPDMVP